MSNADLPIELLPWQIEVWEDPTRFKVIAAGRRSGKSRYAVYRLIVEALQGDPLGDYLYVAPTQGQARDIAWNLLLELGKDVIAGYHLNNLTVKLINGVTIKLKGGDRPETMRGLSIGFVVIDEYADIKPQVWEEILRPALSDREGSAVFIGTPMGRNHFYELFHTTLTGAKGPTYKAWHFTTEDNPFISKAEIEAARTTMSSYAFRQEYMASFEAQGSAMFKESWIKYADVPETGDYYISVDLAGFENAEAVSKSRNLDDTAISIVKVSEQGWHVEKIISGRWSLNETAIKIFEAVREYRPVKIGIEKGIAQQAVMSPLQDLMRRCGRYFNIELMTHGNRKKNDRIMWALQGRFENGFITLSQDEWNMKFLDQLFQFPDPLTHDDLVDSLAYIDQLADIPYHVGDYEFDDFDVIDEDMGY